MPRRNKRKVYTTGKKAISINQTGNIAEKPECAGCAFAGPGGVCATSDGSCLITVSERERREADHDGIDR